MISQGRYCILPSGTCNQMEAFHLGAVPRRRVSLRSPPRAAVGGGGATGDAAAWRHALGAGVRGGGGVAECARARRCVRTPSPPPSLTPFTHTRTHTHTHTHTTSSNGAHFVVRADLRGRRSHGHTRRGCRLRGQDSRPVPRRHPAPDSVGAKWVHHGTERASGCPSDLEGGNESIRACRACARAPTISHALSHTLGLHPPPPSTPP